MQENTEQNRNYIEEDEIDLRELFQVILKGKIIILFVMIITVSLSLVYVLKLPNVYKSETILIPTAEESGPSLGGLGGLAAMAGVSVGGGGKMTPDVAFNSLLSNYTFMKSFVEDNYVVAYYNDKNRDKDYVFAFGFRDIYDFFKSDQDKSKKTDYDAEVYRTVKTMQNSFSISSDKKTALITVSYSDSDRSYPPIIINAFLKDASTFLVQNNLRIIDEKLSFFHKELQATDGFELRKSLSGMVSTIVQEKVMMQSKTYYQCDVLTTPSESYIKDKTKPKRGLILVVSFVTSMILGIFLVFFLEFIRKDENTLDMKAKR